MNRISLRRTTNQNDFLILAAKESGSFNPWVKNNTLEADSYTSLTKISAQTFPLRHCIRIYLGLDEEVFPLLNVT